MKICKTIILSDYIMVFKKVGNWFNNNLGPSKMMESKIVLYILVTIGILNLYTYAMEDDFIYAGIMLIVGFLSTFFNKNMIVIIFTAIAITNLIRFGMEEYKNREGFTGDLSQLDALMNHMTDDKVEQTPQTTEPDATPKTSDTKKTNDKNTDIGIDYEHDKNAKLNEDPTKRDVEIDKFIKNLNPAGILQKMEVGFKIEHIDLAKDKIDLALKHTGKIANEEQRKGVENLLQLQLKMLNQLVNISPLIDEFRDVVKMLNV